MSTIARIVFEGRARLRSLKDLDKAATTIADACKLLLNPDVSDATLRKRIYETIGHGALAQVLNDINMLVRPPDDIFYQELRKKRLSVARFLPTLLRVLRFDANPTGKPLIAALDWLRLRPDYDPPDTIIYKAWKRHMVDEYGNTDYTAYAFCVLDRLKTVTSCLDCSACSVTASARAWPTSVAHAFGALILTRITEN